MKNLAILLAVLIPLSLNSSAQAQVSAYGAAARVNDVDVSNSALEKNFEEYQRENNVNIAAIRYPHRVKEMKRDVLEHLINRSQPDRRSSRPVPGTARARPQRGSCAGRRSAERRARGRLPRLRSAQGSYE